MEKNVKFRNHFLMVVENLLSMWLLWIYLIVIIVSGESFNDIIVPVLVISGTTLFVFIVNFIRWRKTTFIFDGNAIVVEKNTISKVTATIAVSNIASVNINRTLLQALLGIRKVKVDTNSTSSVNSEVEIYLRKDDAYLFQKTIMDLIDGKEKGAEEVKTDTVADDNENDIKVKKNKDMNRTTFADIVLHCIFTMKIVEIIFAAVAGGFIILTEAELEEGESVGGVMGVISTIILVAGILVSFLKSFFAYYKLEAVREGNELNISYGFFDKKTFKMPVSKIVSIKIKEPLVGRLFKKAYAEVVCVGMGDDEKELSLMSLCISKKQLAMKIHKLLPEFIPEEVNNAEEFYSIKKEDKKAVLVRLLKSIMFMICIVTGAITGISMWGGHLSEVIKIFGIVIIALCILSLIYAICKNATSGYSVDNKYFRIANGAFNREINFIPYKKIECMTIKKSPVYKLFGLATANVSTKSGAIVSMITSTCYINDKDMENIKKKYHQSYRRKRKSA